MKIVILAGGIGKRIAPLGIHKPKSMFQIMAAVLALESLAERLPLDKPELWSVRLRNAALVMDVLMTPLAMLMMILQGSNPSRENNEHTVTEDELKTWVETEQPGSSLEKGERQMIYEIFQFGETLCREIMKDTGSLTPEYLEYLFLTKWDGTLPTVMTSASSVFDLSQFVPTPTSGQ